MVYALASNELAATVVDSWMFGGESRVLMVLKASFFNELVHFLS